MWRYVAAALVASLAGFVIMVLEIAGARFLGARFGGSIYVWTSQIGVIMTALAAGYYAGGAVADRPGLGWLLVILLVCAGAFTYFIPSVADDVIAMIIDRHEPERPIPAIWIRIDPAIGSGLIFLLPCLVLAMISPYMVRIATSRVSEVGRTSGLIYAAGTVGSIVGVFLCGYVLIDRMPLSGIFRVCGLLVALLGGVCLWIGSCLRRQDRG